MLIPFAAHSAIKSLTVSLEDRAGDADTGVGGGAAMMAGDSSKKGRA